MPRSNARSTIARDSAYGSPPPKLCQRPSETAGSFTPLRPQRWYVIASYLPCAGSYGMESASLRALEQDGAGEPSVDLALLLGLEDTEQLPEPHPAHFALETLRLLHVRTNPFLAPAG